MLSSADAFTRRLDSEAAAGHVTDDLLTTGYAHALELEAEQRSYDRALASLLALGDDTAAAAALRCRSALRSAAARLRASLASARLRRGAGGPLRGPSPEAS